ncbi:MAG: YegS/Rv2252/BmrU family lipid kinase [Parasporobacterium sp.]|nr:YegS/Rv2252/BmrU family lipid kinase [Parasporobacterium sp.]
MEKILFVYNPNSGKGRIAACAEEITGYFSDNGYEVDVYATKGPLDGRNKVQNCAKDYSRVVCSGGDGTLSEVISGIMESPVKVPVGFIPMGSTNDTSLGFRLPKDYMKAADICINGHPYQADVGRFNDEYFTYVASLGSLSAVSCFTPQEMKRVLGHGAYLIEGIKQLINMESYELTVSFNGKIITGDFFLGMITNSMSVGGFAGLTGPSVDLQDGLFEVALLKRPHNIAEFSREIDLMLIRNNEDREILDDAVLKFKTDKVTFSSGKAVQWVRDGENGGKHKEAVIEVCNKAITVMTGYGK